MNLNNAEAREIRNYLVGTFEGQLFSATLQQVERHDDPLRANNFAYALRELSRHVLKRLGPDDEVREAPWFKQDPNTDFTRAQRMKFAIQGHLEDEFLKSVLDIDYQDEAKALRGAIDELSKFTHVEPHTFNVAPEVVAELTHGALTALANLFRAMFDCRERVLNSVEEKIDSAVVSHVIEETLEGFYDYATHYTTDEIYIESLELSEFNGDEIIGSVSGSVSVILQYGSASDLRRGDGMETDASANFTCQVRIRASNLKHVEIVEGSFEMDYDELSRMWGDDGADF